MTTTLALLALLMLTPSPTPILVTEEYFPVYECGDTVTTPDLEGTDYEVTELTGRDGGRYFRIVLTAEEGYVLLVEGGEAVFERAYVPCEVAPDPVEPEPVAPAPAVPPITELPATGASDNVVLPLGIGAVLLLSIGAVLVALGLRRRS